MDAFRLLSRSTKLTGRNKPVSERKKPSAGQSAQPQLFASSALPVDPEITNDQASPQSKKRKRRHDADKSPEPNFFGGTTLQQNSAKAKGSDSGKRPQNETPKAEQHTASHEKESPSNQLTVEDVRSILKKHKLKITWLNPPQPESRAIRKKKNEQKKKLKIEKTDKAEKQVLYPKPLLSFRELRARYNIPSHLAANIENEGYTIPTEVQLGTIPLLLDRHQDFIPQTAASDNLPITPQLDLLTVAPTGSGKTLAFMLPLLYRTMTAKREKLSHRTASAIILAPTKELVGQIVNEGRKMAQNSGVRISQVRKGMRISDSQAGDSDSDDVDEPNHTDDARVVKSDILVSTPGVLAGICEEIQELENIVHLVLDEADVLLDPLFRDQTLVIWNKLSSTSLRVSLWSATMGSNIEELARSVIEQRRTRLNETNDDQMLEAPLVRLVVGLKDSAVPNIQHRLIYAASEQGKLMGLRQLLHPSTASHEASDPLLPPFLVFTQTIERAIALHSELIYDIPAEAGGRHRIAVLHSDLSDTVRDSVMTRFRKGEIWVLITTDLLSRGVDFRGVNGVVNYDIPTSSAAYVHRAGRTGRAGREGGVAITLYSKEDIPYLKNIANVISASQKLQTGKPTDGRNGNGVQQWLLDALPDLSRKAKQDLKKHGVESRTGRGAAKNPRAARQQRISTKAGFVRREENRKRAAISESQKRREMDVDDGEETDFGGFD